MLKKVIIGIICFILLVVIGAGIYIYTLDWNKHKAFVAQRLTQITGLQSQIEGNLKVDVFPQPKVIAGRVKFFSASDKKTPLVIVNEITANIDLMPLLDNKFIVRSMRLEQPFVNLIISESGDFNWKDVGKNSHTKSGNTEVSFDNVRLNNITLTYSNLKEQTEYTIPHISATVSAPSLQGPYKTDGKFIHNNSEISFNGTISKSNNLALNMVVNNAVSGSKFIIDGTLGEVAKGTISFDTRALTNIVNIISGENYINDNYTSPLFLSFQYDYSGGIAKLDNFTTKYGRDISGSGNILINFNKEKHLVAEFNMAQFSLDVLETIVRDYIHYVDNGGKFDNILLSPFNVAFKLRSPTAFYKNIEVQGLNLGFNINQGILDITNFGATMPGETSFKTTGKVNLNDKLQYSFNQALKSEDFRTFASIFGIDLTKQTPAEYKKSVFKRFNAEKIQLKGDLASHNLYVPQVNIDSTKLGINAQLTKEEKTSSLNIDIAASKILFDKYLEILPEKINQSTLKDKFIYQLNLIPWNNDIKTTARVAVEHAVYNKVPMEDIALQFTKDQENINLMSLKIKNMAGALVEMTANVDNVFKEPQFKELSYSIKTNNFPIFTSSLGFDTDEYPLLKRKLFATQGSLAGSFNDFSLSSVQKLGDTEFSYTGVINNPDKSTAIASGDLEIKANNFTNFVKDLNIDYTPDIPVTVFTAAGKIKGNVNIFEYSDITAYLGANKIKGIVQFDKTSDKPIIKANLDFDKFDADHWFNLSKNKKKASSATVSDFITPYQADDNKIDYSNLKKVDFDIEAKSRLFIYEGNTYKATKAMARLKDGKLNVSAFETKDDSSNISLNFVLDTNNQPVINGQYNVSGIKLPNLGGNVYMLSEGALSANGTFNSRIATKKEFLENLNSKGVFSLADFAVKGWDLDIIKFDLEQRKTTNGFENFIRNSLTTGKSSFAKAGGEYTINKGNIIANNILWQSPVVDMSMLLNFNLSDYVFKSTFDVIYHNASFSDVLKFTLEGNSVKPTLKLDIKDTLDRIGKIEKSANDSLAQQENEKIEKIKDKLSTFYQELDTVLEDTASLPAKMEKFAPQSLDKSVNKTYTDAISNIKNIERKVTALKAKAQNIHDEKSLMDIEAELKIESSQLKSIPKILEDNYIVDSKYVYDDLFNKISWVYNVASNNIAYFNGLSDAYVEQLTLLRKSGTPLPEETETKLLKSIKKVTQDMEKINDLHIKMRDDYLFMVDSSNIEVMNDNIEIAEQALKTILSYTHLLDKDIINSIEGFIEELDLTTRDYNDYMVMPPENIADIDITKPTTNSPKKDKETVKKTSTEKPIQKTNAVDDVKENVSTDSKVEENTEVTTEDKKKVDDKLAKLQTIKSNLFELINNFRAEQKVKNDIKVAENISSSGLSALLAKKTEEVIEDKTSDVADIEPKEIVLAQNEDTVKTVEETKQVALNDIMTEVKKEEENLISSVEKEILAVEPPANDNLAKSKSKIEISDYIIAEEDNKSSLKRNPVIALEIGKELSGNLSPNMRLQKKSAFKFKKARYNDAIQSFASKAKPRIDLPAGLKKERSLRKNEPKSIVLPSIVAQNDNEENSFDVNFVKSNILVQEEAPKIHNKYVFEQTSTPVLSGKIGKSMLGASEQPLVQKHQNKYVFAANNSTPLVKHGGLISKISSLYIK